MPTRRKVNPRLVKLHRTYTTEELAQCFGIHPNTVRNWRVSGLDPIDGQRPFLFRGSCVRDFLEKKRARVRCRCGPDELYCLRCRRPNRPASGMADYEPLTETVGDLQALCPDCEGFMHRRVTKGQLTYLTTVLEITISPRRCA